jgi:hypothetical protein
MSAKQQRREILSDMGLLIAANVIAVMLFGFNVFTGIGMGLSVPILLFMLLAHQTTC